MAAPTINLVFIILSFGFYNVIHYLRPPPAELPAELPDEIPLDEPDPELKLPLELLTEPELLKLDVALLPVEVVLPDLLSVTALDVVLPTEDTAAFVSEGLLTEPAEEVPVCRPTLEPEPCIIVPSLRGLPPPYDDTPGRPITVPDDAGALRIDVDGVPTLVLGRPTIVVLLPKRLPLGREPLGNPGDPHQ